jgi:hypothetical protein
MADWSAEGEKRIVERGATITGIRACFSSMYSSNSLIVIVYCPWCGTKLPNTKTETSLVGMQVSKITINMQAV